MEFQLIGDSEKRKQPNDPLQVGSRAVGMPQSEPGCCGGGDEEVDHGPVANVQTVAQLPSLGAPTQLRQMIGGRGAEEKLKHCKGWMYHLLTVVKNP